MPASSTGKWVQRAGATGGGRTYRGQRPTNWYIAILIIVVVGLASVIFARYQYQNPASASAANEPTVGTTWHAGFDYYVCGTQEPALPAAKSGNAGIITTGNGVMQIAPKTSAEAGANATLGRFIQNTPGAKLSASELQYPGSALYKNGQACPSGTPDAGKTGTVQVSYWPTLESKLSVSLTGDPSSLKLGNNMLITMAFAPENTKLPKPPGTTVIAVLQAAQSSGTTATTAPTTATTAPTTATTAPASTTTVPATTTTGAKG